MYTSLITILGLSFLLGMRHATDADHVVAVSTMIAKQKRGILSSGLIGMLWGLGHSITVTLVAIPIILYSLVIPPKLGLLLEFIVGVMLVILGISNLAGLTAKLINKLTPLTIHKHSHVDQLGINHSHYHLHSKKSLLANSIHHLGLFQILRPIIVGLVHGLAGSAAVALLILSTIHTPILAVFYLFIFHIGVLAGMMLITICIGASIVVAKRQSQSLNRYLVTASGILSLIFGLYIMYQTIEAAP